MREEVLCWIDPATWRDMDICTDAAGNRTEVPDTLGDIVWPAEGEGTVYPIVTDGSPVTLTAGDAGTVTVTATVTDSRTLGDDPPIQRRKVFNVLAPSGFQLLPAKDQPPAKKAGGAK